METNRLQIRRLKAEYLVPAQHPSPELLKERLDQTLTRQLAATLSSSFSQWFSETDPSIWLIRRLDIDVAVNAAWSSEPVTRAFTSQIGRTLGEMLQDSAEQTNVVHFTGRDAYLARFLCDLASGHAWSHWYYESFAGLRMLPTSAALRTAICDQSEPGREALLQLAEDELRRLLRALSKHDADTILDSLASMSAAGDEADCCQLIWDAWQSLEPNSFNDLDESRRALLLYLMASRDQPEPGLNLKRASFALLRLANRLAADSEAQRQQLLSALAADALAEFYQAAGADAEILAPLLRCSTGWLREVAEAINTPPKTPDENDAIGRRHTSFGGAFMLLPFIDELPLAEATRNWPHADEAAAVSLLRLLLLSKCCGEQNIQRSFADPVLRDLLLIPPGVSVEVIRDWQSRLAPTDVQHFLKTLLDWQRARGRIAWGKLILTQTSVRGRPVVVGIDSVRGLWVMAETSEANQLVEALREPLAQLESDDGVLLCDPSLLETLWPEFPTVRMISLATWNLKTLRSAVSWHDSKSSLMSLRIFPCLINSNFHRNLTWL